MRAILEVVSPAATLVEALEPIRSDPARAAVLLDIDGTLAPIVRHAADAHVPEATRTLLIEIAKRYRIVGCISGRRAAHRAPDRRDRDDRLRRQPRRRAAAPGRDAPGGRPRAGRLDRPRARVRGARLHAASTSGFASRSEDKDAIAAFHWRGAPDEAGRGGRGARDRERAAGGGLRGPLGAQGARGAPADRARQGRSASAALLRARAGRARALYVGDDSTDLDAFRGLREQVRRRERCRARSASPSAPTKRPRSSRPRPT